jgi:hypothetical protein
MRLTQLVEQMLAQGLITLRDPRRIVPVVDPDSVRSDRTVQIPYSHSDSFAEAHSLAMEQMAQSNGLPPDLSFDRGSPRGDSTVYSVIIDDPLCPRLSEGRREEIRQFAENAGIGDTTLGSQVLHSEDIAATIDGSNRVIINPVSHGHAETSSPIRYDNQSHGINHNHFAVNYSRLQEKCRTCTYRNKDFDRPVAREHLNDLKCGINPTYAMTGVGECADFTEDTTSPLNAPDEPQASRHRISEPPQGEMQANFGQLLINAIQAIPGVANINVDYYRNPDGWTTSLLVTTESGQTFEHFITPNQLNPVTLQMAINYFEGNIWLNA